MEQPISRFPVPDVNDLPDDIKEKVLAIQERSGFIPNVFLALAHRPDEFRAFFAYHDALMDKESGLTKAEREMIVVATSARNECQYCVVSHGAILRIRAKDPLIADQVATNYRKADISRGNAPCWILVLRSLGMPKRPVMRTLKRFDLTDLAMKIFGTSLVSHRSSASATAWRILHPCGQTQSSMAWDVKPVRRTIHGG